MEEIVFEKREDGLGYIRLNTPPLNLQTLSSMRLLYDIIKEIEGNNSIRALVMTGEGGRVFSAGSDIKEFPRLRGNFVEEKLRFENLVFDSISALPIPTVCAINGSALGGGLELALCFDFRVIEENARISMPEINLGNFPGSGGPLRLCRLIGPNLAMELMSTGRPLTAAQAVKYHIATEAVPEGQASRRAVELAYRLSEKPTDIFAGIKKLVNDSFCQTIQEAAACAQRKALQLAERADRKREVER